LGLFALALAVPLATAFAIAHGDRIASLALALDTGNWRGKNIVSVVLTVLLAATMVAALHVALGLVFDPRYKDFPLASLTVPVIALATLAFADRAPLRAGMAEIVGALVLGASALFIIVNEGIANWQALLFAGLLGLLAATLLRPHAARS
ncbi:MAG: beta-(1-6) glucans synthase, partial [Methyloceanibacter sp.]